MGCGRRENVVGEQVAGLMRDGVAKNLPSWPARAASFFISASNLGEVAWARAARHLLQRIRRRRDPSGNAAAPGQRFDLRFLASCDPSWRLRHPPTFRLSFAWRNVPSRAITLSSIGAIPSSATLPLVASTTSGTGRIQRLATRFRDFVLVSLETIAHGPISHEEGPCKKSGCRRRRRPRQDRAAGPTPWRR